MSDFEKLINASDLIEWIMETYPDWCEGAVRSIVDHIESMPSVPPKKVCVAEIQVKIDDIKDYIDKAINAERKTGKWIDDRLITTNGGTYGVRRCSECEAYYQDVGYGWNYCPNCGARMSE